MPSAIFGIVGAVTLASCGPAVIGAAAASTSDNRAAATTLSGLSLEGPGGTEPKVSPALVRFALSNPDGRTAAVDLSYALPSAPTEERLLTTTPAQTTLASSAAGTEHVLTWNYTDALGIPADASLLEDVRIVARVRGGNSQAVTVRLGNDPPVVSAIPPAVEARGVVPVRVSLADSSDDVVDVRVEFLDESDPDGGWRVARPAGLDPAESTPSLAFRGIRAPREGIVLVFFWDTASARGDLIERESDVRLRFTAIDPVVAGAPAETPRFRVDNNEVPSVQISEGRFVASPDDRRGLPIPFTVRDVEGDAVRVLFQWRRQSQTSFPDLGTADPVELSQLVRDPAFVRDRQICRAFPGYARGRIVPVDATRVRLPELAQGAAHLLAGGGLEFRQLELLRPTTVRGLAATWPQNQLVRPTAAVALGDGLTALVVDVAGPSARLIELDLAAGTTERTIAAGPPGVPTALALDRDGRRALVATDLATGWMLVEVDIATGASLQRAGTGVGAGPAGPLRAVLWNGANVALATADDALWQIDWNVLPTRIVALRRGLAVPWGLVGDPLRPGRVLVAERDRDRVVSIDLQSRELQPLPASSTGGPPLPRPTALAIAEAGTGPRLIALCDGQVPATRELRALNLGQPGHTVFTLGTVPADASTLATGVAGLLLLPLPESRDLAAGGGVEQCRGIVACDATTSICTVQRPFAPVPRSGQAWRIAFGRPPGVPLRDTGSGSTDLLLWDSRDAGPHEQVLLRAVPMDAEIGTPISTTVHRAVDNLDVIHLPVGPGPTSVATADLDGDGDLDLACAIRGSNEVSLLFQGETRRFAAGTTLSAGAEPAAVAAVDIDGDGRVDVVCCNAGSDDLTLFYGIGPGIFDDAVHVPAGTGPVSIASADLDGDGRLDLVCANAGSGDLSVFFQDAPRQFSSIRLPVVTGAQPSSVVAADLDGDGSHDLVCASATSDELVAFYQDAPRMFETVQRLPGGGLSAAVSVADLDGDGDADLVCANTAGASLTVLLQSAPRTFTAAPPLVTGAQPFAVAPVDLDGDGRIDLVCANFAGNGLSAFLQSPGRSFAPAPILQAGLGTLSVTAADLDGNGRPDLVCTNFDSGTLSLFFTDALRTLTATPPIPTGAVPVAAVAGDLDGDGDLDLVSTNFAGQSLSVRAQEAQRTFALGPTVPLSASNPQAVVMADVDGDGNQDLVCGYRTATGLTVHFQELSGDLAPAVVLPAGTDQFAVAAADLDADGDLDIVCVNRGDNSMSLFFQDAPRTFTAAPPIGTGLAPHSVAISDLDGDSHLDLVCANRDANSVQLFFQDETGNFIATAPLVTINPSFVVAADLDGDGAQDLVCVNRFANSLTVFYQDGSRNFVPATPLSVGGDPVAVAVADLDGDGDSDLACVKLNSNSLSLFLQEQPRSFVEAPSLVGDLILSSVGAADLDRDGDVDLYCTNRTGNAMTVFFGRSR